MLVVFLVRTLHASSATVGIVMALSSAGGIAGAMVARRLARSLGSARAILACNLGGLPFALLLPLSSPGPGLTLAIASGVFVAAAVVAGNIIAASFVQTYVPSHMLGRVSACIQTMAYSMMPAGALISGAIATTIGLRPALWLLSAGIALSGTIFLTTPIRHARDLPSPTRHAGDLAT